LPKEAPPAPPVIASAPPAPPPPPELPPFVTRAELELVLHEIAPEIAVAMREKISAAVDTLRSEFKAQLDDDLAKRLATLEEKVSALANVKDRLDRHSAHLATLETKIQKLRHA
jgi:hypothetical protein